MPAQPPYPISPPAPFWAFDSQPPILHFYRAEFAGSRDALKGIRDLAAQAAAATQMGEIAVAEFEMAVDEACANIVEHSYEKQEPQDHHKILIDIALFADRIECIITDYSAVRFSVKTAPAPDLASFYKEERKRGLGLDIIRHCVDKVEHQWLQPQGNQTRLIKSFQHNAN